jgi:hypothetical protein
VSVAATKNGWFFYHTTCIGFTSRYKYWFSVVTKNCFSTVWTAKIKGWCGSMRLQRSPHWITRYSWLGRYFAAANNGFNQIKYYSFWLSRYFVYPFELQVSVRDFNWYFLTFILLHNGNICFYIDYCQTTVAHTRTKYLWVKVLLGLVGIWLYRSQQPKWWSVVKNQTCED